MVHSVESFTGALRALGHEVYIIAPDAPGVQVTDDPFVVRAPSFHTPLQPPQLYLPYPVSLAVRRRVRALGLDIFHTHGMFLLGRQAAGWARAMEIPHVHTYHTLLAEYVHYAPGPPGPAKRLMVSMSRRFCNACSRVVVPAPQIESVLRAYGVVTPMSVVPTGIDLTPYRDLDRAGARMALGYSDTDVVLVWLARLTKEKSPEWVIDAFRDIHAARANTRLLMVGGGVLEAQIRHQVAAAGLADVVRLTGAVPHSEVPSLYAGADFFVYASTTDTQAIVIPEAMAAGLPAVAVDAGGVGHMVRDGVDGYLVALDRDAFVARALELVDDAGSRARMSEAARESASELSSAGSARKLLTVYESVLRERMPS